MLNMTSMSSGFFAPTFAGLLLDHMKDQWMAWSIIFYFSGGMLIVSTIVFLIFASAERQPFDLINEYVDEYEFTEKSVVHPSIANTTWITEIEERQAC